MHTRFKPLKGRNKRLFLPRKQAILEYKIAFFLNCLPSFTKIQLQTPKDKRVSPSRVAPHLTPTRGSILISTLARLSSLPLKYICTGLEHDGTAWTRCRQRRTWEGVEDVKRQVKRTWRQIKIDPEKSRRFHSGYIPKETKKGNFIKEWCKPPSPSKIRS